MVSLLSISIYLSFSLLLSLIYLLQWGSCIVNEFWRKLFRNSLSSHDYHVKQFLAIQWKTCMFVFLGHSLFSMQKDHSPCDTTGKVGFNGHFSAGTLFYNLHTSLEFDQLSKNLSYFAICKNCNMKCNNHVCKMGSWSTWLMCVNPTTPLCRLVGVLHFHSFGWWLKKVISWPSTCRSHCKRLISAATVIDEPVTSTSFETKLSCHPRHSGCTWRMVGFCHQIFISDHDS